MRQLHHLCIQTANYEESLDFYCRILEFRIRKETKNFHARSYNTWLEYGDIMIELQTNKDGEALREYSGNNMGLVHFCFQVDDLNYEYERIKSLGYENFKRKQGQDVYIVEGGQLLKVIAPEGTIIELRDNPDI